MSETRPKSNSLDGRIRSEIEGKFPSGEWHIEECARDIAAGVV